MSSVLGRTLRLFFCALLLTTAIGKLLDNRGFAEVIATYQFAIPEPLLLPLALMVSLVELSVGISILSGIQLRSAALLTVGMHAGYLVLAVITNLRGIAVANCGCFGVFLARPMTWQTVIEDTVLLLLSLCFLWTVSSRSRRPSRTRAEAPAAA